MNKICLNFNFYYWFNELKSIKKCVNSQKSVPLVDIKKTNFKENKQF